MKLSKYALSQLGKFVTGDNGLAPYRSGPNLVAFFNRFGSTDIYPVGGGFPSRWMYAESKLEEINGTSELPKVLAEVFDPLAFRDKGIEIQPALDDVNRTLKREKLEVVLENDVSRIRDLGASSVRVAPAEATFSPTEREFIEEHLAKCERKLAEGDYAGAITNARSLCEEVLVAIEKRMDASAAKYDGDLPRLYKRIRQLLKLEPEEYGTAGPIVELLRGLTTVVNGLSGTSNSLADRHGGSLIRPKRHHAALAINSANTLCSFILASYAHQHKQ